MRFNAILIFFFLSISWIPLIGQNVGVNTTTPEGTFHIRGAGSTLHPNLRITDTVDGFARIKMETTLGGNRFWDIAAKPEPGFTQLNFYYQNDTVGTDILQIYPEVGQLSHRSITPSVRTLYYANIYDYQGVVGFNQEDLLLKAVRPDGRVLIGTRGTNQMVLDTIGRLGLGIESPEYLADFRGNDDMLSGGELQLSTPSETNFLRFFGGRQGDPNPFIAFHESDSFHIVTTSADWSTYQRRMTMLPNGHVGLGTDKPIAELDIKTQDPDDGAALHLRNSDSTHFLRLFAGRQNLTTPIMYWNHGSAMEIGMTAFDDSDYRRFLSLDGKTIGVHNTGRSIFIGEQSGAADDLSPKGNIGIGDGALTNNVDLGGHVAVGDSALHHNGIGAAPGFGEDNTAIGFKAMYSNTLGGRNTAVGYEALSKNINKHWNTAVGYKSLHMNNGASNSAVGHEALMSNTSGFRNNAFGSKALFSNQQGTDNQAFGYSALEGTSEGSGNIGIGSWALVNNQSGNANIAIGTRALLQSIDIDGLVAVGDSAMHWNGSGASLPHHGTKNTGVGSKTLLSNTTGSENTALGFQALKGNLIGGSNTAIGSEALSSNVSWFNTAIGAGAMEVGVNGSNNVAVGYRALRVNDSYDNVAVGRGALQVSIDGQQNTAIGSFALNDHTDGFANTAVGVSALRNSTTGDDNAALGKFSGGSTSGDQNVSVGNFAMERDTSGSDNIAIGYNSMATNRNGSNNIVIGSFAGDGFSNASFSGNILIGKSAGFNTNESNRLYIENSSSSSPLIYGEFDSNLLRVNGHQEVTNDLKVGSLEPGSTSFAKMQVIDDDFTYLQVESHNGDAILQLSGNTDAPSVGWTIRRDASNAGKFQIRHDDARKLTLTTDGKLGLGLNSDNPAYDLYVNGSTGKPGGGSWTNSSDRRLKRNIDAFEEGLAEIEKINPVKFQYNEKSGYDTTPEYVGVIAQELQDVAPYMVSENERGYLDVNNSAMTYMLVNAVKELKDENEDLNAVIAELNARLDKQESMMQSLISKLDKSTVESGELKTKK